MSFAHAITSRPAVLSWFLLAALAAAGSGQSFAPPSLLAGDADLLPSAGNQSKPVIARGAGSALAVWEDDRSSLIDTVFGGQAVGTNVPGNVDLYGVLLDDAGAPLSPAPFVLCDDSWDQVDPRVSWNGSEYLVVFESTAPTEFFYSSGIYAVRVSAAGVVLDAAPILISDLPFDEEMFPSVASSGGRWLVTWSATGTSGFTGVFGAFVEADGSVGAASELVAGSAAGGVPTEVELAGATNRYLLIFTRNFGGAVQARLFDALGAAVGGTLSLTGTTGTRPAVGSNGSSFYATWIGGVSGFRGTPIGADGSIAVPGGTALASVALNVSAELGVGWNGSGWTVAFNSSPHVYAVGVLASGTVAFGPSLVTTSPKSVSNIAVSNGAGATQLLWSDSRNSPGNFGLDPSDVYGATATTGGSFGAATAVSVSPPAQVGASLAGDPQAGYLVVYRSLSGGSTRILARHVDAAGVPTAPEPFLIRASDRSIDAPDVAWNGSEFLVAWHHVLTIDANGPPPLIESKRCLADGTLLDAAPVVVMEGNSPAVAAIDGVFLVVARYHHPLLQSTAVVRSRRRDGATGAFLDATPTVIITGASGRVDVVALLDRWFVAWGIINGAMVLQDGTPQVPFYAADVSASNTWFSLSTNAARDEAVIAYQYDSSLVHEMAVRLRRIALDGSSPDPLVGPLVSNAHQAQLRPVCAPLADEYLVLWADHRDALDLQPGISDVYAARLDLGGALLDPEGIAVHDDPSGEGATAVLRTGATSALCLVSDMQGGAYGAYRLALGTYSSEAPSPWTNLGGGTLGSAGPPTLAMVGTLEPASPVTLHLVSAVPSALTLLFGSFSSTPTPFLGGTLHAWPATAQVFVSTNAVGELHLSTTFPGAPSGSQLWFQAGVLDAGVPVHGASLSNCIKGLVP